MATPLWSGHVQAIYEPPLLTEAARLSCIPLLLSGRPTVGPEGSLVAPLGQKVHSQPPLPEVR